MSGEASGAYGMDGRLVLDWTYEGDCGAQAFIRGTLSRSLGAPMPSHVCAWAARGVTCSVRAKSWAEVNASPNSDSGALCPCEPSCGCSGDDGTLDHCSGCAHRRPASA